MTRMPRLPGREVYTAGYRATASPEAPSIAPLVNGTVGLVAGLLAGWLKGNRHPIAKFAASVLGATGALLACKVVVTVLRSRATDFRLPPSWFWLTLILGSAFLAYYLMRRR